jgi:hypothetical protein
MAARATTPARKAAESLVELAAPVYSGTRGAVVEGGTL